MSVASVKKGQRVSMFTFTGMNLGQFEVVAATKETISVEKKDGTIAEFSRKTGKQTNASNEKYANKITEPVDEPKKSPVKAKPVKKDEPKAKDKKGKKVVEEPEEDEDIEEDEDFEEDEDDDYEDEE